MFCDVRKYIHHCLSDQIQGPFGVILKCITCMRSHCHRTRKCPHFTNKFNPGRIQGNYMLKPVSENYIVLKWNFVEADVVFLKQERVLTQDIFKEHDN